MMDDDLFHPADFMTLPPDNGAARHGAHASPGWYQLEAEPEDWNALFNDTAASSRAMSAPLPGSLDDGRYSIGTTGDFGRSHRSDSAAAGAAADMRLMANFGGTSTMPAHHQPPQQYPSDMQRLTYDSMDSGTEPLAVAAAAATGAYAPQAYGAAVPDPSLVLYYPYAVVHEPDMGQRHAHSGAGVGVPQFAGAGAGIAASPLSVDRCSSTPRRGLAPPSLDTPGSWASDSNSSLGSRGHGSSRRPAR